LQTLFGKLEDRRLSQEKIRRPIFVSKMGGGKKRGKKRKKRDKLTIPIPGRETTLSRHGRYCGGEERGIKKGRREKKKSEWNGSVIIYDYCSRLDRCRSALLTRKGKRGKEKGKKEEKEKTMPTPSFWLRSIRPGRNRWRGPRRAGGRFAGK